MSASGEAGIEVTRSSTTSSVESAVGGGSSASCGNGASQRLYGGGVRGGRAASRDSPTLSCGVVEFTSDAGASEALPAPTE